MFAIYLNDVHAARSLTPRSYIILYADDILMIVPSIGELQSLFHVCEIEQIAKLPPLTKQHLAFYRSDSLPVTQPKY